MSQPPLHNTERIDAGLHLLDRQVVDRDGLMAGKVDDLELTFPEGGGPPVVTAILAGPGALAGHLGGRMGRWLESAHRRLREDSEASPPRIPFGAVVRVGNHIGLGVCKEVLGVSRFEDWARDRIVSKIPGASHAPE